jgi:hypothetical protein
MQTSGFAPLRGQRRQLSVRAEGGPVYVNEAGVPAFGAAMITEEKRINVITLQDAELLLVEVKL